MTAAGITGTLKLNSEVNVKDSIISLLRLR